MTSLWCHQMCMNGKANQGPLFKISVRYNRSLKTKLQPIIVRQYSHLTSIFSRYASYMHTIVVNQDPVLHIIITKIVKPCISNWVKMTLFLFYFFFFLSLVSLYWQNFACQSAEMLYLLNLVTYMTCNLVLTAVNVFILSRTLNLRYKVLSSQRRYIPPQLGVAPHTFEHVDLRSRSEEFGCVLMSLLTRATRQLRGE